MRWHLGHALRALGVVGALWAGGSAAQDKSFTLSAPTELVETGFLTHLLPRFSLKTSVRINIVEADGDASFGAEGTPVFREGETIWHFDTSGSTHTDAFLDWLTSDIGKRTIEAFQPEGGSAFSADVAAETSVAVVEITGDVAEGERVSLVACGRCHVVSEKNRLNGVGSSPSFRLLRGFEDWQGRFETFYTLKPHPAFTQITDVTAPFDPEYPSPIVPIELSLDQLDAILAYVSKLQPADLGAPIQFQ